MIKQQYSMQCPQCGQTEFEMSDNVQVHDLVKCNFCHYELTVNDLRAANVEQVEQIVRDNAKEVITQQMKKLKWSKKR